MRFLKTSQAFLEKRIGAHTCTWKQVELPVDTFRHLPSSSFRFFHLSSNKFYSSLFNNSNCSHSSVIWIRSLINTPRIKTLTQSNSIDLNRFNRQSLMTTIVILGLFTIHSTIYFPYVESLS